MSTNEIKLPKTVTKTLYVSIGVGEFNFNNIKIKDFKSPEDITPSWADILLKTQEITIDLSDSEIKDESGIKSEIVKQLKKSQEKIKADSHVQIKNLQDRIDNLLAIDFKPEVEEKNDD